MKGEENEQLGHEEHKSYRAGVGKLVYLSRWSRTDILNAVRELARYVSAPTKTHYKANIIKFVLVPGETMRADLFTKNLDCETFQRHAAHFIGKPSEPSN